MYAEIAFPISSYQTFTYEIPAGLRERVQVGVRVKAPLGRRTVQGVVVGLSATTVFDGNIRAITALVDDLPVLDEKLWTLLKWVGRHYLTPLGQAARTALPKSLTSSYRPPTSQLVRFLSFGDEFATLQKRRPAQARLLQHLSAEHGAVPVAGLKELAADPTGLCKKLAAAGLVEITDEIRYPDATGFTFAPVHKEVVFSEEQNRIMQTLSVALEERRFHPALLHGVTGSGKTEIYIELVRQALAQGRTAILLLPEIALTPQIAGRFRSVFGETVALWHSKLSSAARSWTWRQLCAGQYSVVIGARSAIFTPLRNLGLIVVDEEQEHSYKQESPEPRYHARDVALMRGKLHAAVVLLASATPSLESYYNQIQSKLEYLHLSERFGGARYPRVHLVNMNQEQEETGKAGQVLSGMLLEKIADRLSKKEQIILLQNRRGYAPILRCGDCGEILNCPNCQISLTYHRHGDFLQCHFCGYTLQRVPDICPVCRGANLRLAGTGTQKVEDVLAEAFPAARLVRLDLDTTRSGTVLTRALEDFGRGRHDILLGTQMIAKGLDFGNATQIGRAHV